MQNTQHSFKLDCDNLDISNIASNLKNIGAFVFAPISPNVNWHNISNFRKTKSAFREISPDIHISSVSSDMGKEREYSSSQLVGGTAIITFGLWFSKVCHSEADNSGLGTFSITTLQGKREKKSH